MSLIWAFLSSSVSGDFNPPTNQAPTINLVGSSVVSVTQNGSYTEFGATAFDAEDGNITSNIVITGTVNTSVIGAYTKTYTITDSNGAVATTTRTVNVIQTESVWLTFPYTFPAPPAPDSINITSVTFD